MSCFLALVAVAAIMLVVLQAGCKRQPPPGRPAPVVQTAPVREERPQPPVAKDSSGRLSRDEVRRALERLAESPPPSKLSIGADCYARIGPPATACYVCAKCGDRTLYARRPTGAEGPPEARGAGLGLLHELPEYRRQAKEVRNLDLELDESEFCGKCRPEVSDPQMVLVVRYPGTADPHRCRGVNQEDLRLIRAFLAGRLEYVNLFGEGSPLKERMPRLRELLGAGP